MLIASVGGTCKFTVVRYDRITPFVRVGAISDIRVQYHFGFGKEISLPAFRTLSTMATDVMKIGSTTGGILSALTAPAFTKATADFETAAYSRVCIRLPVHHFREAATVNPLRGLPPRSPLAA
jgi:hypothetical protein